MAEIYPKLQVSRREILAAALLFVLSGLVLQTIGTSRATLEQQRVAARAAGTIAGGLRSEIEKYELVTIALSTDRQARDLLLAPSPDRQVALNQRLSSLRDELGASVIYLMDLSGNTVVASNWQQPDSFVGQNYRFRSYFRDALARGEQRQYALGTRSRLPGLYLARRISDGTRPLGVIVVKIRFDPLEHDWQSYPGKVFATDTDGVVLITDDPEQRFRTLAPLSEARRAVLRRQLDFGDATLMPDASLQAGARDHASQIEARTPAGSGLMLHVIQQGAPARRNAQLAAWGFTSALMTAAIALLLFARSHRQRLVLEAERSASQRIELLKDELAQANRLAILGQIVAGVSHEIGQPVAAITLQADTGRQLAAAGDTAGAGLAFQRIGDLIKRITAITGELRRFARRSKRDPGPSHIGEAIAGALLLLGDRIAASRSVVRRSLAEPDLTVEADGQRCEQILVNLLQNALDATAGQTDAVITITVRAEAGHAVIDLADNGPGVDPAMLSGLFQAFHTGKPTGLGLGLVISRDLARGLGGDLVHVERQGADGSAGACFRLTLALAR